MRKIYGMTIKDWKTLGKLLNPTVSQSPSIPTVAEYLAQHPEIKTERRVSKKGREMIKVFYPTGKIKEYEAERLDDTTAYEY